MASGTSSRFVASTVPIVHQIRMIACGRAEVIEAGGEHSFVRTTRPLCWPRLEGDSMGCMSDSLQRKIFANRTLNLRSIKAIGYDLDYTLVHYNSVEWERRAYEHTQARLVERGCAVGDLEFDPEQVIQGLTIDLELGNLLKVTRFGYVIRAPPRYATYEFSELRRAYAGTVVDLAEHRWVFLNTLFSLSEATLFAQLVDLADQGRIPEPMGYEDLYRLVRASLDDAPYGRHVES